MSNSKLVNYTKLSPYCNKPRNAKIDKITIHHMAGNLSVETCGNVFQSSQSSSNYGIGSDGRVGMYVEEANRSWASSSPSNDHRAVTIEVANDGRAPDWHVSDKALAKLIDLCVDICQRNGIKKLNYTGDKTGNLTRHNMFAATTCPGPYLQGKFPYIAEEVNKRLGVQPEQKQEVCKVEVKVLRKGAKGQQVKALQTLLIGYGYSCGSYGADGDFGSATDKAVRAYQKATGLVVDGIVGQATWAKLLGTG
jgi:N-acetyl-anhydromuramyl-L-alanine amidase AmpD